MKLYVIRHGFTNCNKNGLYNGLHDEDINDDGILQATKSIPDIEKLDINLIFCSPLKRTKHTCQIINTKGIPVIYDNRLVERTLGELDLTSTNSNIFDKVFSNYYSTTYVQGMETYKELFNRVQNFLDDLSKNYTDKNVLIVTHGGVARAIHFCFNEIPTDGDISVFRQKNCEVIEYEL